MELTVAKINVECVHSKYIMHDDDILEIQLKDEFYFTIKESIEITTNIFAMTYRIPHKDIIVAGSLSFSDDGARNYYATK